MNINATAPDERESEETKCDDDSHSHSQTDESLGLNINTIERPNCKRLKPSYISNFSYFSKND